MAETEYTSEFQGKKMYDIQMEDRKDYLDDYQINLEEIQAKIQNKLVIRSEENSSIFENEDMIDATFTKSQQATKQELHSIKLAKLEKQKQFVSHQFKQYLSESKSKETGPIIYPCDNPTSS